MKYLLPLVLLLTTAAAAQEIPSAEIQPRGGDFTPPTCHLTPERPPPAQGLALRRPATDVTPVSDVSQCPGDPTSNQCGDHCIVDISGSPVATNDPRQILKAALRRCNTTVRLGPDVDFDFSPDAQGQALRPLRFGRCVTLTSVSNFDLPTSSGRTPRTLGPVLRYGPPDPHVPGSPKTFLQIICNDKEQEEGIPPSDHIRISGFRLFGPSFDHQSDIDVGIRIQRCVDVEISNMEIADWGVGGIVVQNSLEDQARRIKEFSQVRIHDNFIHHNQHPSQEGSASGYGVEVSDFAWAHIYRNVFDFNRHAIAADGATGGYIAEENLVLKGGGWHGRFGNRFVHIFDVHGTETPCYLIWWRCVKGYGGQAGEEIHFYGNAFQYRSDNAIHIRGKPRDGAYIGGNVFPHDALQDEWGWDDYAIRLRTQENVTISDDNVIKTDTFGDYAVCDFDADGIDDLFLATGATWWFSSSGTFHWSFLNTSSKRKKNLRFGYFDDDDHCDVLTESGGSGRWMISSGGTGPWKPLEQVWRPQSVEGAWKSLAEVHFGRFDPSDVSGTRRTTHAFHRAANGEWRVKNLSDPTSEWEYVGGSSFPLRELRFGDFNGDGVTDVLAVERGRWAVSESARRPWRPLNRSLADPVADLLIANMDRDDKVDDILRFEVRSEPAEYNQEDVEIIWWRSKNGIDQWREFKRYFFRYPSFQPGVGFVYPNRGFVGRFGAVSGGTLVIDEKRIGHFFSPGSASVGDVEWISRFPY